MNKNFVLKLLSLLNLKTLRAWKPQLEGRLKKQRDNEI